MEQNNIPQTHPTPPHAGGVNPAMHSRRLCIDFTPRRRPQPLHNEANVPQSSTVGAPRPRLAVAPQPRPVDATQFNDVQPVHTKAAKTLDFTPVRRQTTETMASRDFVDGMPVAKKKPIPPASTVPLVRSEVEIEMEEPSPSSDVPDAEENLRAALVDFANDGAFSDPQADFLSEEDSEDYVETVLSQISETRTETTVRRSPFLKNYKIEKRPLSDRVPEREQLASADALQSTPHEEFKEETFESRADSVPEIADEPLKTKTEKTGSKLGMIITVAVTILLGAGVGVFVYLAFFQ